MEMVTVMLLDLETFILTFYFDCIVQCIPVVHKTHITFKLELQSIPLSLACSRCAEISQNMNYLVTSISTEKAAFHGQVRVFAQEWLNNLLLHNIFMYLRN